MSTRLQLLATFKIYGEIRRKLTDNSKNLQQLIKKQVLCMSPCGEVLRAPSCAG